MRWQAWSIISLIAFSLEAQELELVGSSPTTPEADFMAIDQFGRHYLVLGPEIQKLDVEGKFEGSYSDPVLGEINQIDLLNPLGPLIYFQSSNVLHILDNRLNLSRSYNLSFQFQDPKSVAVAAENSIWLYDQNSDRMLRYALDQKKVLNQSQIISQVTRSNQTEVLEFKSGFDQLLLYLKVNDSYWFIAFDGQGAYEWKMELPFKPQAWDYHNQRIAVVYGNNSLQFLNLNGEKAPLILCPQNEVEQVFFFYPELYLISPNSIHQYHLQGL